MTVDIIEGFHAESSFGSAVFLSRSGNRVVVSASTETASSAQFAGATYIFDEGASASWTLAHKINGTQVGEMDGHAVSLSPSGRRLAISSIDHSTSTNLFFGQQGRVRVFDENADGKWNRTFVVYGNMYDALGNDVALNENMLVVGIPQWNQGRGTTALYNLSDGALLWNKTSDVVGARAGASVALSGHSPTDACVALGAPGLNSSSGNVFVYENLHNTSSVTERGVLPPSQTKASRGTSVSMSGDCRRLVIGEPHLTAYATGGVAQIFDWDDTMSTWRRVHTFAHSTTYPDQLGLDVAISADGSTVAIGAPRHRPNASAYLHYGRVYVLRRCAGVWTNIETMENNAPNTYGGIGSSVSLSADGRVLAYADKGYNASQGYGRGRVFIVRTSAMCAPVPLPPSAPTTAPMPPLSPPSLPLPVWSWFPLLIVFSCGLCQRRR